MKVIQIMPTLALGDAVSNDALALEKAIINMGYKTEIYAENIDPRLPKGTAKYERNLYKVNEDDVVLYHLSTGTFLNKKIALLKCRKIVIYHNITPGNFFEEYSKESELKCLAGREEAASLCKQVDYCLADSEYNKQELIQMGCTCPIDVLPILIPFDDYRKEPDIKILDKYKDDGYTNILFTGRLAPNKKQEDVIRAFYFYKKFYNPKSRLILIGSDAGMSRYSYRLKSFIAKLELEDVIIPGHISFAEILAYYHTADLFLCQSEHEGFCVPLVEAMFFDIPVVAYHSTAIPYTMGDSGIVLDRKDAVETAAVMNRVLTDEELHAQIVEGQRKRLADFDNKKISEQFEQYMRKFLRKEGM